MTTLLLAPPDFQTCVVLGIYNFACGSTHFANVRSEDRTDQLASVWISQNMAAELILRFAIVFAKFAFSSWLNSEMRPGTGLILTSHWNWKLLRRTGLKKLKVVYNLHK